MDEQWRQKIEDTQAQHGREIAELKRGHAEMQESLENLTGLTRGQTEILDHQTEKIDDIRNAMLGTMEKPEGLVQTIQSQQRWQSNATRAFWGIATPALAVLAAAFIVVMAMVITKGFHLPK